MIAKQQHRWRGHALQLAGGQLTAHHAQAKAADQLAVIDQVELGLALQAGVDLLTQGVAVGWNAEVAGDGQADR